MNPLPPYPFTPAPIPAVFPKDTVDPSVAAEQEKIRAELDSRLTRWTGPSENLGGLGEKESGIPGNGWWMEDIGGKGVAEWGGLAFDILFKLRNYKDYNGVRIAESLEQVDEQTRIPYLSFNHPVSLRLIQQSLESNQYYAPKYFDIEMMRLFEKGRRYYASVQRQADYGNVIALQRLYQALTSTFESPSVPLTPTLPPLPSPSPISHSYIPAGPGLARPTPDSGKTNYDSLEFTGLRIVTKDRTGTQEARWKGCKWRTGDYVHLINPEDRARPIVGQIFRSFVHAKGPRQHWVTVCWYYRPEQTWHNPLQMFYEREICKTGIMVEHPVEDIIERVGCQFYTKYARGRPQPGEWYPGWPLYICNSRYNEDRRGEERGNHFVKIKNWGSCVPEELRKTEFMRIVEFDRAPHQLRMEPSPFLRGLKMGVRGIPGGISWDVRIEGQEDMVPPTRQSDRVLEDTDTEADRERKRIRVDVASTPMGQRSGFGAAPSMSPVPSASLQTPGPGRPRAPIAGPSRTPAAIQQVQPPRPLGPPIPLPQGSVINARTLPELFGGVDQVSRWCDVDAMPAQSTALFDRDPLNNKVLWFSGPPLDLDIPEAPHHTGTYLKYLAKQKLTAEDEGDKEEETADGDDVGGLGAGLWGREKELEALLFGET